MYPCNSNIQQKKILITTALPYANGPIHLGHILETIQADIWSRVQRMVGHEVIFLSAEDAHGTAIMLRAEKENKTPEALITDSRIDHLKDFKEFSIEFDNYYTSHSEENRALVEKYYTQLNAEGLIYSKDIEQAYDPIKLLFLADRFIKGKCPKCQSNDQYGDACEICGATYSPKDMNQAYSIFSNQKPIWKQSQHYFFKLSDPRLLKVLKNWIQNLTQQEIKNKLQEWLQFDESEHSKLKDWDISRDAPYFGFEIPGTVDKFFYVWLDAPIGYFASLKNFCDQFNLDFNTWISPQSETEQYHFIGKDILYFHTLFWPAMCFGAGLRLPTNVYVHGFLTVNGKKMSKSRGTFITARDYINAELDPDALRYYICAKLNSSISDIDLNLNEFSDKINSDLIGKYINIASRTSRLLHSYFKNTTYSEKLEHDVLKKIHIQCNTVYKHLHALEYSQAVREIMLASDTINLFIDQEKPWILAKSIIIDSTNKKKLHKIISICIEAFRLISIMLKPIVPNLIYKVENFLNIPPLSWESVNFTLPVAHIIKPYTHLMKRIDKSHISKLQTKISTQDSHNL